MKLRLASSLILIAAAAWAAVSSSDLDRYANGFASDDNIGLFETVMEFHAKVPAGERAGVLVQLWETKGAAGQSGVLNYLVSAGQGIWNPALAQHLKEAATAKDAEIRRVAINVWKLRPADESRPILAAALEGPFESDRMNVMHAMSALPDRDSLLADYVKRHAKDKDRTDSSHLAQAILERRTADKHR